jgi:RimJ/RimL family protein N-acetyltransferase
MKLLEFIPATRKILRQLATEPEEFAAEHGVILHDVAQSVGEAGLKFVRSFPYETPPEWFGYLAVEGESQRLCGVCTFKGPALEGAVEISYYTFPGFEGRGIGTAMAGFLVERARSLPDVTRVIAHTFEQSGASPRILQKIGMHFTGEAEEDGEAVWGWELELTPDLK